MKKNKNTGRNILLALGVAVGILIFLLGSYSNSNFRQTEKRELKMEQVKEPDFIIKKFFS